jgi:hypothetical protein
VTKDEEIVDEMYDNTQQDVADRNENYERLSKMRK